MTFQLIQPNQLGRNIGAAITDAPAMRSSRSGAEFIQSEKILLDRRARGRARFAFQTSSESSTARTRWHRRRHREVHEPGLAFPFAPNGV